MFSFIRSSKIGSPVYRLALSRFLRIDRASVGLSSFQYQLFIVSLQVHVLMCVDSPYIVDRISFELPLMKQMGDSVQMEVTSVRPYEAFYDDLEKLA